MKPKNYKSKSQVYELKYGRMTPYLKQTKNLIYKK